MKRHFLNAGKANAEIDRLEAVLGIYDRQTSKFIFNIAKANERIDELEKQIIEKGILDQRVNPSPKVPAAVANAVRQELANTATPAPGISRRQCIAIIEIADPPAAGHVTEEWTDAEVMAECERACYQANVQFPGMRSESELATDYWRKFESSTLTGLNRLTVANRQKRIDETMKTAAATSGAASKTEMPAPLHGLAKVQAAFRAQLMKGPR